MAALAMSAAAAEDIRDAQALYSKGQYQPALEKVNLVLNKNPKDAQGRFLKGLIFTEQKKVQDAIQVFTGLTEDYPELPEPYNNLAVLYASQGNYEKARAALELAIHTHPTYGTAYENLGDIYAQLARRAYDKALALDKNNAAAQSKLAMVKDLFSANNRGSAPIAPPAQIAKADAIKPESTAKPATSAPPAAPVASAPAAAPAVIAKAEPAKIAPAPAPAPAVAPASSASEDKRILETVDAWAKAWSEQDVTKYLSFYGAQFETPGGESRADWEKLRTERVTKPKSIQVAIANPKVSVNGNEATVTFRQNYRSDVTKATGSKTLRMSKEGDRWMIVSEKSGA